MAAPADWLADEDAVPVVNGRLLWDPEHDLLRLCDVNDLRRVHAAVSEFGKSLDSRTVAAALCAARQYTCAPAVNAAGLYVLRSDGAIIACPEAVAVVIRAVDGRRRLAAVLEIIDRELAGCDAADDVWAFLYGLGAAFHERKETARVSVLPRNHIKLARALLFAFAMQRMIVPAGSTSTVERQVS